MIPPDEIALTVLAILGLQSVYALVLFPLVWGLVKCCREKYPRWQHGLWLLIVFRLVLPPDMAIPWSASHLIRSLMPQTASGQYLAFTYDISFFHDRSKPLATSISDDFAPGGQYPFGSVSTIASQRVNLPIATSLKLPYLVIFWIYLSVVMLLLVRFLQTRRQFWRIARQAKTVLDPAVLDIVHTWRRRLHIRRQIKVKTIVSDGLIYTIGLFRPIVIIPERLVRSTGHAGLEPVLAHELVHVKRGDDLAICMQELVRIVYFFHPLVWFVMPRLTWTREAICDGTVISRGTLSPRAYGRQLIAFARGKFFPKPPRKGLVVFTSTVKGVAFRLNQIQKEDNMESKPLIVYLTVLILGLFLLPMAPVASSNQGHLTNDTPTLTASSQRSSSDGADNALMRYIMQCAPCRNAEEISRIIWGDRISEDFQEADYSHLVSAMDCDIVDNIGDGRKAYVFYLLSASRRGVYRPNFHFIMEKDNLRLLFKSRNLASYATERPKVNGRYEIEEGWRADFLNGANDKRVNLVWGSTVWFWSGTQYLKAYSDYTVAEASDPSLLGTTRKWEQDIRSLYEAAIGN